MCERDLLYTLAETSLALMLPYCYNFGVFWVKCRVYLLLYQGGGNVISWDRGVVVTSIGRLCIGGGMVLVYMGRFSIGGGMVFVCMRRFSIGGVMVLTGVGMEKSESESRCRCIWTRIHIEHLASGSTSEFVKKKLCI